MADRCVVAVMNRDEYRNVYLVSEHWLKTRAAALKRADSRCQVCNGAKHLDVHHRTYERLGAERDADLTVLCRSCHDTFHGTGGLRHQSKASKKRKGKKKRYYKGIHAKGTLANDLAAMKHRNASRTHGGLDVQLDERLEREA